MKNLIDSFKFTKKINILDRLIFILISLIPLSLAISIFCGFNYLICRDNFVANFFLNKENDRKIIFLLKKKLFYFLFYI